METGSGRSMYNNNFGGIKGQGPSGQSVAMRTREREGDSERKITDKFRAYDTPAEGASKVAPLTPARRRPSTSAPRGPTSA